MLKLVELLFINKCLSFEKHVIYLQMAACRSSSSCDSIELTAMFRGLTLPRLPWAKIVSLGVLACGFTSAQALPTLSSAWSFTDLDGDTQSDRVRSTAIGPDGLEYRYNIEFEMSTGRIRKPISILSGDAWGLQIASRDVDGDHDMDLVVTGGTPRHPLGVWTNDGDGNFTGAGVQQFSTSVWLDDISFRAVSPRTPDDAADFLTDSSPVVAGPARFQSLSDTCALLLSESAANRAKSAVPGGTRPRAPPLA